MIAAYLIHHPKTNKVYFGSTNRFEHRKSQHLSKLKMQYHPNKELQAAYNEDPTLTWTFKEMPTSTEARQLEKMMIDANKGNPYMMNETGAKPRDREIVERIRSANIGRKRTPEFCQLMAEQATGVKHTQEAKDKMSAARKGVEKPEGFIEMLAQHTRKKLSIEGVIYRSMAEAAELTGLSHTTIRKRALSGIDKFRDWFYVEQKPVEV